MHKYVTDNKIGPEGAKVIAEMLKTNKTVTILRLWSEIYKNYCCRDALFLLKINVVIVCCR